MVPSGSLYFKALNSHIPDLKTWHGMQRASDEPKASAADETEDEREARHESAAAGLFRSVVAEATGGRVSTLSCPACTPLAEPCIACAGAGASCWRRELGCSPPFHAEGIANVYGTGMSCRSIVSHYYAIAYFKHTAVVVSYRIQTRLNDFIDSNQVLPLYEPYHCMQLGPLSK